MALPSTVAYCTVTGDVDDCPRGPPSRTGTCTDAACRSTTASRTKSFGALAWGSLLTMLTSVVARAIVALLEPPHSCSRNDPSPSGFGQATIGTWTTLLISSWANVS